MEFRLKHLWPSVLGAAAGANLSLALSSWSLINGIVGVLMVGLNVWIVMSNIEDERTIRRMINEER